MKRRNWILIISLIPLFLVLAGVAAVLLIPTERVGALAADRATLLLDREVTIEGVSLSLLPRPGVALSGITVAGRVQDEEPVATVDRVELRPRILPLLRRQVVIDAVVLERPQILVDIDAQSISNLPLLEGLGETTSATDPELGATPPAEGSGIEFLVRRLEINDAQLGYRDARSGTTVRIAGLGQRLRIAGDLVGGELQRIRLDGRLTIGSLSADAPEVLAVPVEGLRLQIEHHAALDLAGDSLTLDRLGVTIQELELDGAGTVLALSDPEARTVSLRLGAGPVDVGQLIRSLPEGLLVLAGPEGGATPIPEVEGVLSVDIGIAGRIGGDSLPDIDGSASFERFGIAYTGMGEFLSGLDGTIVFSLDSLMTTGLTGRLLGEPLYLEFAVHDLAAPHARGAIRAGIDLSSLAATGLLPDSVEASGRLALDLEAEVPFLTPVEGVFNGSIGLQSIQLRTPAVQETIALESGVIDFERQRLRAGQIAIRLGESDLALELDAHDWLGLALGDSAALPKVSIATRSRLLDLDAILGPADSLTYAALLFARMAERPVGGRPVEEVARELGLGLPMIPPMELEGDLRIGEMRRDGLLLRDIVVGLAANGDRLELADARFQMMGGGIQVTAQIGMPLIRVDDEVEATYPVVFSFDLQDVGAAPFFDTFTPFREHLSGTMLLAGTGRATLDEYLLPLRESVAASGTIALDNGELVNWPVLKKLGEQLGAAGFDTLTFRDWDGRFSISGPRIMLHETTIGGGEIGIRAAGELGFNGVLDLGATVELPASLTSRIRSDLASRLTSAVASADGNIPIGVKVTGPALSPKLELDLSEAATNLTDQARREAEARLKVAEDKAREAEAKARAEVEARAREAEAKARAEAERAAKEAAKRAGGKLIDRLRPRKDSTARPDSVMTMDSTSS